MKIVKQAEEYGLEKKAADPGTVDHCDAWPCPLGGDDSQAPCYVWEQGEDIHGGMAIWTGHEECFEAAKGTGEAEDGRKLSDTEIDALDLDGDY